MKKKIQVLACLLIGLNAPVTAQTARVQLNMGNFTVPYEFDRDIFNGFINQAGISYTHQLSGSFSIKASYNKWILFSNAYPYSFNGYGARPQQSLFSVGRIIRRYNHNMIDVSGTYQHKLNHKHALWAGLGVSYTWGEYEYVKSFYKPFGNSDAILDVESKSAKYLGLIGELGYNYFMFNNRINIGVSESVRAYPNMPLQLYFNLNLGYNFSWKKPKNNLPQVERL
jgi:hypothetical protein